MKLVVQQKTKYEPVSKFPFVKRDLSLLVDQSVSYSDLENGIQKVSANILKEVELFDVYF